MLVHSVVNHNQNEQGQLQFTGTGTRFLDIAYLMLEARLYDLKHTAVHELTLEEDSYPALAIIKIHLHLIRVDHIGCVNFLKV